MTKRNKRRVFKLSGIQSFEFGNNPGTHRVWVNSLTFENQNRKALIWGWGPEKAVYGYYSKTPALGNLRLRVGNILYPLTKPVEIDADAIELVYGRKVIFTIHRPAMDEPKPFILKEL